MDEPEGSTSNSMPPNRPRLGRASDWLGREEISWETDWEATCGSDRIFELQLSSVCELRLEFDENTPRFERPGVLRVIFVPEVFFWTLWKYKTQRIRTKKASKIIYSSLHDYLFINFEKIQSRKALRENLDDSDRVTKRTTYCSKGIFRFSSLRKHKARKWEYANTIEMLMDSKRRKNGEGDISK